MAKEIKKSDFIQSLEKGLKVIQVFDATNNDLTISDVAKLVGLTRANARRILLTLEYLGYVKAERGKYFSLTPRVLGLGYSYLSAQSYRELAIPYIQEVSKTINESCSMSVLDGTDVVYIARVHTQRIMTIALSIGSRLPLHATSMGKVLLAHLDEEEQANKMSEIQFESFTTKTLKQKQLQKQIKQIADQGFAISNEELEIGVKSIAVPVRDKTGEVIAAINISGHASRVTIDEMKQNYLPVLQHAAHQIELALKNII